MKKRARAASNAAPNKARDQSLFDTLPTDVAVYALSFLSLPERFLFTGLSRSTRRLLTARPHPRMNAAVFPHTQHVPFADNLAAATKVASGAVITKLAWTKSLRTFRCVAWGEGRGFVGQKLSFGGVVRCFSVEGPTHALAWRERVYEVDEHAKTSVNSLHCGNSRLFVGVSKPSCAVHCFDVESGEKLCQYASHKDSVFSISVNRSMCFSGGGQTDNMLLASDLETQQVVWSVAQMGSVRGIDSTEQVVVSGSLDGRVRRMDVRTGQVVSLLAMSGATVHGVDLLRNRDDPRDVIFSTGRPSCSVRRWDMRKSEFFEIASFGDGVSSVVANAYAVAAADYQGNVGLTSLLNPQPRKTVLSRSVTADGKNCDIHSLATCAPNVFFHCQGSDVVLHAFK
jgi:WD40 repeat protein